jgi:hypothetical protein
MPAGTMDFFLFNKDPVCRAAAAFGQDSFGQDLFGRNVMTIPESLNNV